MARISAALCDSMPDHPVVVITLRQMHSQNILSDLRVITLLSKTKIITAESDLIGHSAIDVWSNQSKKWIKTSLSSPAPIEQDSVCISSDAHFLLACESTIIKRNIYYSPHRLFVWDLKKPKLIKTFDVGQNFHLYGVAFLSKTSDQIVLTAREGETNKLLNVVLSTDTITLKKDYPDGTFLMHDQILFSPDGKQVACVYPTGEISPNRIDFLDVPTDHLIQTLPGNFSDRIIATPYFFLNTTHFLCNNFVYDLDTKQATPLFAPHDLRLKCISDVPGKLGYGFFLTKAGLELWYIPRHKMIRRWHSIKRADHLYFALDHSAMGVLQGETLQLWPFDPRRLPVQ